MGLPIEEVIRMVTATPAKVIGEDPRRGSLRPGLRADITVMELLEGDYQFSNGPGGEIFRGNLLLEPRMVIHGGSVVPAHSRYHIASIY